MKQTTERAMARDGGSGLAGRIARALHALPGRAATRRDTEQRFRENARENLFLGVFDTFEAAAASAPPTRPLGYDNPESAALYLKRLRVDDYDYPALFWLSQALAEGLRGVGDIGGSVGIKYFAFGRILRLPPEMAWRVIEVPAVVRRGREFASERGVAGALQFDDDLAAIDGLDVLLASGSLQYLPLTLPEILAGLGKRPRRIIVNTTPMHATRNYFTLNSVGTAFCPYRVQHAETFVHSVSRFGYRLRDEWRNVGKRMEIPFHPEESLDDYSGFCFDAVTEDMRAMG
jgi:putative methyltransferase (TIGR04325 family)